jgi:voltage-gated potassium channel
VAEQDEVGRNGNTPGKQKSWRLRAHDILEDSRDGDRLASAVNIGLVILIVANVIAFAAETVPAIGSRYADAFAFFNIASVIIFTVEYALRIWSCVENPSLGQIRGSLARIRFALRPLQIIDLLAILPFYLAFLFAIDLRVLRILRLFRFLKLARYSPALFSLGRVMANERRALTGALLVMMALLLFASTIIYFLERQAQPEVFSSIPAAAWWAIATLTTVGYGDVVPMTPFGRLFGALIMIFGLASFALPIGIIATGFSHEANRREFVVTWGMVARVPVFSQLNAKSVAEIAALLFSQTYQTGEPIVRIDDTSDAMYFIASGEVAVDADDGRVILSDGDFFGEMAIIDQRPHAHNVTAVTRCRILVLDKSDLERLAHREPEIMTHIKGVADARRRAVKPASRS